MGKQSSKARLRSSIRERCCLCGTILFLDPEKLVFQRAVPGSLAGMNASGRLNVPFT